MVLIFQGWACLSPTPTSIRRRPIFVRSRRTRRAWSAAVSLRWSRCALRIFKIYWVRAKRLWSWAAAVPRPWESSLCLLGSFDFVLPSRSVFAKFVSEQCCSKDLWCTIGTLPSSQASWPTATCLWKLQMLLVHLRRHEECRDQFRGLEPSSRMNSACVVFLATAFIFQIMFYRKLPVPHASPVLSEEMTDRMPEDMPDRMSEDLPDRMPEDMPDRMSEDMPDRIPDRMSEDMTDRISGRYAR